MRNRLISRQFVTPLLPICSPAGEREPRKVTYAALGWVAVERYNERTAVRVPELVGDHVSQQATAAWHG